MFNSNLFTLISNGFLSVLYFEFLIFILPFQVKANPFLPNLVGKTQSNISIPLFTDPRISEGVLSYDKLVLAGHTEGELVPAKLFHSYLARRAHTDRIGASKARTCADPDSPL